MPPKKRTGSLGRKTPGAQKEAESRKRQSPDKRDHDLQLKRQNWSFRLETETEEEREQRLQYHRDRRSTSRARETSEERQHRLEYERNRQSTSRARETSEERDRRLHDKRERQSISRARETSEERDRRLHDKRERQSISRARETSEERDRRLQDKRERQSISRARETSEERDRRLQDKRERQSISRARETSEERDRRLQDKRERQSISRANETPEDREERLATEKRNREAARENETPAQRRNRQRKKRQQYQSRKERRPKSAYDARNADDVFSGEQLVDYLDVGSLNSKRDPHVKPDFVCTFCKAVKWKEETNQMCCNKGAVQLTPIFEEIPDSFKDLWTKFDLRSRTFRKYIRPINNAMAMACMSAKQIEPPGASNYNPSMRINSKVFVGMGPLHPDSEEKRCFAQLYVVDPAEDTDREVRIRMKNVSAHLPASVTADERRELRHILQQLQEELKKHNSYVGDMMMAHEILGNNPDNVKLCIDETQRPPAGHSRVYNRPLKELTVLMDDKEPGDRDFRVVYRSSKKVWPFQDTHRSYDPLHFVLFFPTGTDGWHRDLKKRRGGNLTPLQFYAYYLHERHLPDDPHLHPLLRGGRLLQEFCCVEYAKTENQRLKWIVMNQKKLRAEKYNRIAEDVYQHRQQGGGDFVRSGRQVILPPSFPGSPRYMHAHFQDATAIVREFHKPDLFITFTCNPGWREITDSIFPGQTAEDRPDIVARVFNLKLKAFMNEVRQKQIFGRLKGFLYVIEWQKRGLPHAHILLILAANDRLKAGTDADCVVSAELPVDPDDLPVGPKREQGRRLQAAVLQHMLHSCRVGVCKESQEMPCKRFFPKRYCPETRWNENTFYPEYRRRSPIPDDDEQLPRDRGLSAPDKHGRMVDSANVVPYNPYLLLKFDAHINVELCVSALAAKYLFKYVTKGGDRAMVQVGMNEVEDFQDMRSIGASEACWRFFQFHLTENYPFVKALRVHLEDEQVVMFEEGEEETIADDEPKMTELDQFFNHNRLYPNCNYRYVDFPKYFVWDSKEAPKEWSPRKSGGIEVIGRIHTVHPVSGGDTFYLRILLHDDHCKGKTSFVHLRTVDGVIYETFKETCRALGLLQDDREWSNCLTDAAQLKMCPQIRLLFSVILLFCEPGDPSALFERHCTEWWDDLKRKYPTATDDQLKIMVLLDVEDRLRERGKELNDFNLPSVTDAERSDIGLLKMTIVETQRSVIEQEETAFDFDETVRLKEQAEILLTPDQQTIYSDVLSAVENNTGTCFFVNASGGTGKTFTLNLLLAAVRTMNNEVNIALAVASSGIAATLLTQGRTFHSRFKASMDPNETSMLNIPDRSALAQVIRDAKLIVWDEAPMTHRYQLEALDRTLRNLMDNDRPFGGKVIVLAGDFRQVLPVVERGNRSQITNSSVRKSKLWKFFTVYSLTENLRVRNCLEAKQFNDWLLQLGNGEIDVVLPPDVIELPTERVFDIDDKSAETEKASMEAFVDIIFPNLKQRALNPASPDWIQWVSERAILAPLNSTVDDINRVISTRFPGEPAKLRSADSTVDAEDSLRFPVEFLNTMMPSGLPPHQLEIKPGMILMLLRNLSPRQGLCNGTRLIVDGVTQHLLRCRIARGEKSGEIVLIPRIELGNKEGDGFPIRWKRRQYPVRPSFAITSNKAQGQTLDTVGVWLQEPSFTHGQLYVASSRVSNPDNLHFAIRKSDVQCTRNVVYTEALGL